MKIYLLRHGKSAEHEKQVRQHPGSDLGPEGKKQAKKAAALGNRLQFCLPQILTSSKIILYNEIQ